MKTKALIGILALLGVGLYIFLGNRDPADFKVFYTAGTRLASGHSLSLYSTAGYPTTRLFVRPAWQAILFLPFSLLPYPAAFAVWDAVNLFLFGLSAWLLRDELQTIFHVTRDWRSILIPVLVVPAGAALALGQDTALLLLLLVVGLKSIRTGRDWDAGICLGLASIDLHLIIPALILIALRRRWDILKSVALTGVGLLMLSFAVGGPDWIPACINAQETMQGDPGVQTIRYFLTKAGLSNLSVAVILATAIAIAFYIVWNLPLESAVGWIILATVFLNWHVMFYDYVVALPAMAITQRKILVTDSTTPTDSKASISAALSKTSN